ncbi:nuclear transport factor 2 family protein [Nocardia sp. NBC_00508]|uniref:hypothetical protein n=1 Tax=Nocardia sp. NBC_00508 TaxID=2975992 RepID=UPI002E82233C|nr:hypothetical protein [Nocardia sp. NBC_00508]WUD64715.1 nuclear transport factor 2 family protein [Nocardia sp. NBC_00508]
MATTDIDAGRLERSLAEFEDREAIRDVLYRYARAADLCDLDRARHARPAAK